jgi:hypothetical protein
MRKVRVTRCSYRPVRFDKGGDGKGQLLVRAEADGFAGKSVGVRGTVWSLSAIAAGPMVQPTREQLLRRAYEIGYLVSLLTAALMVLLGFAVVMLVRRRQRSVKADEDLLRAAGKRRLGVLPFAVLLSGASIVFLVLFWIVTVKLALSYGPGHAPVAANEAASSGTPVASARPGRNEMRLVNVVLDDSGVYVNGRLVAPAQAIPSDKLERFEPLAAAIGDFYARREDLEWPGLIEKHVRISSRTSAVRAASAIMTFAQAGRGGGMHVHVDETEFKLEYLGALPIPKESFLYLTPQSPRGFVLERQQILRDPRSPGPACRRRSQSLSLATVGEITSAVAKLCGATPVDCVDHVELGLASDRTFGETIPWLLAAMREASFPYVRFVDEGVTPIADAVACGDGGRSD